MSIDKMTPGDSHRKILRSTSVMSFGTLASRILGFVRDMIFAGFFGTAAGADAFVVAFRIPNLFRDIIGEGAANSSFVPVLTEYKERRPAELRDFLNAIFIWAIIILIGISLVGMLFASQVVRVIAPGFAADPGKMALAADLTRIMFPYLLFIGLTAFFSAIQFAYGSFTAPAFGPCLLNVALIVSTLLAVQWMDQPVYGLAIGVLVGGVLQFAFQWWQLKKHGVVFSKPATLSHAGVKSVGRLLLPRIFGTAVYQMNVFVDTICASLTSVVGPGAISAIYYANRIVFLPLGIFGVALATASLPIFSSHVVGDRKDELKKTVAFSLQNIIFLMLPMTAFLCLLSEPIIRVIFQRGVFDAYSTTTTASALFFFSLGLVAYGGVKILAVAFHSLQDTRTPVKVALLGLLINAVLNVALMGPLKISGIALASSIAAFVNVGALAILLQKRIGSFEEYFDGFFRKALLAVLGQGVFVAVLWKYLVIIPEMPRLIIVLVLGSVAYWFLALALKMSQPVAIKESFLKKSKS